MNDTLNSKSKKVKQMKKQCTHFLLRQCGNGKYQCENDDCLKIVCVKFK